MLTIRVLLEYKVLVRGKRWNVFVRLFEVHSCVGLFLGLFCFVLSCLVCLFGVFFLVCCVSPRFVFVSYSSFLRRFDDVL